MTKKTFQITMHDEREISDLAGELERAKVFEKREPLEDDSHLAAFRRCYPDIGKFLDLANDGLQDESETYVPDRDELLEALIDDSTELELKLIHTQALIDIVKDNRTIG